VHTAVYSRAVHASADLHSVNAVSIVNEFDYNGDVHICMSMRIYMMHSMNSILVARQEGKSAHKTTVPNVPKGSLPEDVNRGIARNFCLRVQNISHTLYHN